LIAAGGISSQEEIDTLAEMGVDAVVGMAIYTGKINA
jgi:phosphoribosylformimino-5-aminoimidazole carboxamide ribotide isomerase